MREALEKLADPKVTPEKICSITLPAAAVIAFLALVFTVGSCNEQEEITKRAESAATAGTNTDRTKALIAAGYTPAQVACILKPPYIGSNMTTEQTAQAQHCREVLQQGVKK